MVTEPIDWRGLMHEAEGHEWHGLPAGTKIGHVHLHVNDLNAAKRFYCDQLGLDMMLDGSSGWGALFIAAGGYHHHLGLNIWAGAGAPRPPAGVPALTITRSCCPMRPLCSLCWISFAGQGWSGWKRRTAGTTIRPAIASS